MEYLINIMRTFGWYEYASIIRNDKLDVEYPTWQAAIEACICIACDD